jgi:hypothetical protein
MLKLRPVGERNPGQKVEYPRLFAAKSGSRGRLWTPAWLGRAHQLLPAPASRRMKKVFTASAIAAAVRARQTGDVRWLRSSRVDM